VWVPSHIGITGNEIADKAANLAITIIPHPTSSDLSTNDIKSSIKNKTYSRWQKFWDTIPLSNKLKTIKKDDPPYHLNRRQEVVITRCKIGHSLLTHSFLLSKNPPPTCDECHIDLSIHHIIQECTKYLDIRNHLKIPPTMEEALNENNITKIITFLTKINLINKL
jgi:hypothetical protein